MQTRRYRGLLHRRTQGVAIHHSSRFERAAIVQQLTCYTPRNNHNKPTSHLLHCSPFAGKEACRCDQGSDACCSQLLAAMHKETFYVALFQLRLVHVQVPPALLLSQLLELMDRTALSLTRMRLLRFATRCLNLIGSATSTATEMQWQGTVLVALQLRSRRCCQVAGSARIRAVRPLSNATPTEMNI